MSLKTALLHAIGRLVRTAEIMAALTLVIGVLINFANVVGRYCFAAPIPWAEEAMIFLMIAGVFLGASAVTLKGAHIRMDILEQMMPRPVQRALDVLGLVAFIVTATALIAFAYPMIRQLAEFDQRSEVLRVPIAYPHSVIPVGLVIMILAALARLVDGRTPEHGGEGEHAVHRDARGPAE